MMAEMPAALNSVTAMAAIMTIGCIVVRGEMGECVSMGNAPDVLRRPYNASKGRFDDGVYRQRCNEI